MLRDQPNVQMMQEIPNGVVPQEKLCLKSMDLGIVLLLRQHHLAHRPALVVVVRETVFLLAH